MTYVHFLLLYVKFTKMLLFSLPAKLTIVTIFVSESMFRCLTGAFMFSSIDLILIPYVIEIN